MTNPYIAAPPAPSGGGKVVARTVLAILGVFGAIIVALVFAIIWIVDVQLGGWGFGIVIFSALLAMILPVGLFAMLSGWRFAPSDEGRAYVRRWVLIFLGIELLSIAAIIVMGFVSRPQIWLPITLVALAVAFSAVALLLGPVLRSPPPAPVPLVLGPWAAPKAGAWFWWVVAAIVVVPAVGLLFLLRPWTPSVDPYSTLAASSYFLAIGFATIIAAFACVGRTLVLSGRMKPAITRDFILRRKVSRTTFGSKPVALEPDELEFARRNAVLVRVSMPWQIGYIVLLLVGLSLEQVPSLLSEFSIGPWFVVALLAVALICAALLARYIVLAGRFLRVNGQPTPVPTLPVPQQLPAR